MKRVRVALGLAPYDILIGRGVLRHEALRRVLGQGASGVVVSSKQIMDLHSATLQAALHAAGFKCGKPLLLPEGEAAKTVQQWDRMMRSMAQARLDRSSFVIAFGGGSIGDAAGFVTIQASGLNHETVRRASASSCHTQSPRRMCSASCSSTTRIRFAVH